VNAASETLVVLMPALGVAVATGSSSRWIAMFASTF
jgi:hypothetical protein